MKVIGWIIALCGLWEFGDIVAPFVIGFDQVKAAVWNHIFIGLILMIVGAWAALTSNVRTAKTMDWIAAAAGAWLIVASFILRNPAIAAGLVNDVLVGAIVIVLSITSGLLLRRRE